jgi:hypothetical protein
VGTRHLQVLDPTSTVNYAVRMGTATVAAGLTSSLPGMLAPTLNDVSVISANVVSDEGSYKVTMTIEIVVNVVQVDEASTRRRRSLLTSGTGRTLAQADSSEGSEVRSYDVLPRCRCGYRMLVRQSMAVFPPPRKHRDNCVNRKRQPCTVFWVVK